MGTEVSDLIFFNFAYLHFSNFSTMVMNYSSFLKKISICMHISWSLCTDHERVLTQFEVVSIKMGAERLTTKIVTVNTWSCPFRLNCCFQMEKE